MHILTMQRRLGQAQVSSVVRTIPVAGAVYPFHGASQPTFGPRVTQGIVSWLAAGPARAAAMARPGSF